VFPAAFAADSRLFSHVSKIAVGARLGGGLRKSCLVPGTTPGP
jgi:hypothetical protein